MEIGAKTIAASLGIFLLGVGSTYWLMAGTTNSDTTTETAPTQVQHQPAMQAALAELNNSAAGTSSTVESQTELPFNDSEPSIPELTHDAFIAEAEARREQQLIEKSEAERTEKLRKQKENSVECKFWRQQQKASSAAEKIEAKVKEHCFLPGSSSTSETSVSSASSEVI